MVSVGTRFSSGSNWTQHCAKEVNGHASLSEPIYARSLRRKKREKQVNAFHEDKNPESNKCLLLVLQEKTSPVSVCETQSAIAPLCLLCPGSNSCHCPHPQKIYACPKFISLHSLVRITSQLLSQPLSVMVLTDESCSLAVTCPLTLLIPNSSFQNSTISRDIDTAAKFVWVGTATVRGAGSGVGIKTVFGSLSTCYAKNPSLKLQFFSEAIPGFALLNTMGVFCLRMAFLILFAM
ncbi:LOW QUALITY PROTEIN: ATP synthase F(0) complex subunit C2, mitochondrial-like [Bos javanicus]|uniref:LOW QUALITY PROTEIN: ATP synthase F(0) complex subunit C2, mitochondrial-like n=1 Tax=Bos javanicus TaxID=9906 RepID=UPI002AA5F270|nr:LOW QUALITY PROTEIN: ATP synthase F(0) complex subunit C2, mitochondrial-like [Bos javanicus]